MHRPRDIVWENILPWARPNVDQHRQGHTNPNLIHPCQILEPISSHAKFITIISQWAVAVNHFWIWCVCVFLVKWGLFYVTPIPGISEEAGIHVIWMISVCRLRTEQEYHLVRFEDELWFVYTPCYLLVLLPPHTHRDWIISYWELSLI